MTLRTSVLVLALAIGLGGCSSLPKVFAQFRGAPAAKLEVRAAKASPVAEVPQELAVQDRLYARAREAIGRRDYGAALDLLQLAKEQAPGDARILNALAVTYDKLGRFDLSSRYYAQALQAEPGSRLVEANLRYSAQLQGRAAEAARLAASPPRPPKAPETRPQLALAKSAVAPVRTQPLLMGAPLLVYNASSRPAGQEPVRVFLAEAGWSVKSKLEARPARSVSEIRFAEANRPIAEALARTLPFEVALQPCAGACANLELWVGENASLTGRS